MVSFRIWSTLKNVVDSYDEASFENFETSCFEYVCLHFAGTCLTQNLKWLKPHNFPSAFFFINFYSMRTNITWLNPDLLFSFGQRVPVIQCNRRKQRSRRTTKCEILKWKYYNRVWCINRTACLRILCASEAETHHHTHTHTRSTGWKAFKFGANTIRKTIESNEMAENSPANENKTNVFSV